MTPMGLYITKGITISSINTILTIVDGAHALGHARSSDLVHWEDLPVALAPDQPYDSGGCFSGSAIERDGKLYLFYTGCQEIDGISHQHQCLAVSEDGIHFSKYSGNPVVAENS